MKILAGVRCPACKAPEETPKNNNSIWCQAHGFLGAHWFLWSCWCFFFFFFSLKFQKRIMVPGILRAHASIKQNAEFAAVSQYLWSIMGSTENPGILSIPSMAETSRYQVFSGRSFMDLLPRYCSYGQLSVSIWHIFFSISFAACR